jgi:hypothetical protein
VRLGQASGVRETAAKPGREGVAQMAVPLGITPFFGMITMPSRM